MKICYVFLLCCLFIITSPSISLGEGTLHTFTTLDGRALKAKIKTYNERTKKIQIEREDGKLVSTLPSVFSELDQEYIQQWIAADQFMSLTKFRIKADSTETEISKNKTEVVYEITLENKTDYPFKDLRIEYRAFILSQGYEGCSDSSRVGGGQLQISEIPAEKKISQQANPISLISQFTRVSESSRWEGSTTYEKKTMRENLKGFWIKVYGPENDGTPTIREWYYPSNTSEDFSWTDKITRAPEIKPNWAWTPERPADTHDYSNKELTLLRKVSSCQRTAPEKALKLAHECYEIAQAPRAAQMLGHLYIYKLRNIPLGLEWLEKAANGNDFNACIALARFYATDGESKYRNTTKAVEYGQQAVSIRPQDFYTHRILATACAQDGYFEKAVKHQSLAITLYREGDSQSSSYLSQIEVTLELYQNGKTR